MHAAREGVAAELAGLIDRFLGARLPIGLTAWDGSSAGPADGPRLVIRSRRALRRLLWDPNELGLARAFVSGDLDVEGDLAEGLRRCWALARDGALTRPRLTAAGWGTALRASLRLGALGPRPRPPALEARPAGKLHTRRRDRAVIAHHYDLGNDFYQVLLDSNMAYSCAYYTDLDTSAAAGAR